MIQGKNIPQYKQKAEEYANIIRAKQRHRIFDNARKKTISNAIDDIHSKERQLSQILTTHAFEFESVMKLAEDCLIDEAGREIDT